MEVLSTDGFGSLVKTHETVDLSQYDVLPEIGSIQMQGWKTRTGLDIVQFRSGSGSSNPWRFALSTGEIVDVVFSPAEQRELKAANASYNAMRGKPAYY